MTLPLGTGLKRYSCQAFDITELDHQAWCRQIPTSALKHLPHILSLQKYQDVDPRERVLELAQEKNHLQMELKMYQEKEDATQILICEIERLEVLEGRMYRPNYNAVVPTDPA